MNDIDRILNKLDSEQRATYSAMSLENQLLVIFSLEMSNSNRLAIVEKRQADFTEDVQEYRLKREKREVGHSEEDVMNTTQKIIKAIAEAEAKRFDFWMWFRDRVLPQIITLITLAVLYLTFGGKLP